MSLARYAGVGVVATGAHYAVLGLLVELVGVAAAPAAMLGAVVGALVAYLGNRRLTFAEQATPHAKALPKFAAVALVGAVANGAIVGVGVWVGLHYLVAQVAATVIVMALTYHANRVWTFS